MAIKSETLTKILENLTNVYKIANQPCNRVPLVDQIVYFILSREETKEKVQAACQSLTHHFVDWNEVRVSHPREIQEILTQHLTKNVLEKAIRIKEALFNLFNLYNRLDLQFLWEKDFLELQEIFKRIPGLDEEFLCHLVTVAFFESDDIISTACLRVGSRLNLWEEADPYSLKKNLLKEIGGFNVAKLARLLHLHGEAICTLAQDCNKCCILAACEYGKKDLQQKAESGNDLKPESGAKKQPKRIVPKDKPNLEANRNKHSKKEIKASKNEDKKSKQNQKANKKK